MSQILHDNANTKAIEIPQVFSENSLAKKLSLCQLFTLTSEVTAAVA